MRLVSFLITTIYYYYHYYYCRLLCESNYNSTILKFNVKRLEFSLDTPDKIVTPYASGILAQSVYNL